MGIGGLPARQAVVGQRGVLGQRYDTPWHADPVVNPDVLVGHVDVHQLGRSAADVEDQRRALAGLHQIVATEDRKLRFLGRRDDVEDRSEEHTSELQSLMRRSYAVFYLK